MTFLTKEQQELISLSQAEQEKIVEIYSKIPEIYPVSIKDIEEAMKKCANMNK